VGSVTSRRGKGLMVERGSRKMCGAGHVIVVGVGGAMSGGGNIGRVAGGRNNNVKCLVSLRCSMELLSGRVYSLSRRGEAGKC
jgi:hypothetical protein